MSIIHLLNVKYTLSTPSSSNDAVRYFFLGRKHKVSPISNNTKYPLSFSDVSTFLLFYLPFCYFKKCFNHPCISVKAKCLIRWIFLRKIDILFVIIWQHIQLHIFLGKNILLEYQIIIFLILKHKETCCVHFLVLSSTM